MPSWAAFVHKWTSAIAQGMGGVIVIHSLSKNLGLFGKGGLRKVFAKWLREFPWSLKTHILVGLGGNSTATSSGGMISQTHGAKTIEERVSAVELQLVEIARDVAARERALIVRIEAVSADVSRRFADATAALSALDSECGHLI